ncbi:MAG TPA: ABC transporter substrate-binding protein [Methylomirabilota bacterium]|nr:ABC transporter substrate-binding protein [Methylomirabilota bacterium]
MRTRLLVCLLALIAAALLLGAPPTPAQPGPIKIGFLAPLTGGAAQIGRDTVNGFEMYLSEAGNQIAGRKVELIVEDTAGNPTTAITKMRKLVESDRVHMVMGEVFAHIGYALAAKADEYQMPTIFPVIAADDLTQRKPSKWVVRLGWASSQPSHPFGEYVAKTLGYKKIAVLGSDYAFGYEVVGGFQKTFEEHGGQIIQKLWAPLGTTDLAPYLTQLKREADAAFVIVVAATALKFPTQYQDAGLKGKLPVIGGAVITDEAILPSFGDEALGIITPLQYSAAIDTPANKRFVAEYRKRFGKVPSYFSETCYTTGRWINEAAKLVGGKVEDKAAFLAAFRKVEIPDSPRGPLKLDPYGNPIQNVYVRKVERKGGELQNTVIHMYPAVSQFWTYKPEDFLKQPLYNRDVPACKAC